MDKPAKPSGITCDPRIQFGAPCVAGTRVTTEAVYSMYLGMEKICTIADCFGVHEDDVTQAIALEKLWAAQREDQPKPWESCGEAVRDLWWRFRGRLGGDKC